MSERRTTGAKINPTLFDKLIAFDRVLERLEGERSASTVLDRDAQEEGLTGSSRISRFNETALRNTVRRELNWLLNTTRLEAVQPLDKFPQVRTSVLNYGVADMTGRAATPVQLHDREEDLRTAIVRFEPRIDPKSVRVSVRHAAERIGAVSYLIEGDVISAVKALPVKYMADIEMDSSAARVRE